jgi:hypothetical protein
VLKMLTLGVMSPSTPNKPKHPNTQTHKHTNTHTQTQQRKKNAPATESTAASAPLPPVISLTRATRSSVVEQITAVALECFE